MKPGSVVGHFAVALSPVTTRIRAVLPLVEDDKLGAASAATYDPLHGEEVRQVERKWRRGGEASEESEKATPKNVAFIMPP